jgi:hypothetical protein
LRVGRAGTESYSSGEVSQMEQGAGHGVSVTAL